MSRSATLLVLGATLMVLTSASPVLQLAKADEVIDYRLPTIVVPEAYIVCLVPYMNDEGNKTFTFDGTVNIQFHVVNETSEIVMHSYQINIADIEITESETGENVPLITPPMMDPIRQFLRISINDSVLVPDKIYYMQIRYTGILNTDMTGFYQSSYTQGGETKWMATTQFQPTHARKAFPCFDEPAMKATFVVNIARNPDLEVRSNTPLLSTSPRDSKVGDRVWDTFEITPRMSTYLLAFMMSDFTNLTSKTSTTLYSVYARQDAISQAEYAFEVGPKLLGKLEEYTQLNYTLPKLDNVAIPDFSAGAMENWGLITYRETNLLYDAVESTESNKQRVANVLAHEMAHMWFGDLVTLEWWMYTWLNEGFARYLQYVIVDQVETEWEMMDQFVVDHLQTIFRADSLVNAQSLTYECGSPSEIQSMFGSISYSKGASVLRMLDHILGRTGIFQRGLNQYLQKNSYENSYPDNLFDALQAVVTDEDALDRDVTVKGIMDTWTLQSGYPYIKIYASPNGDNQTLFITQQRFLFNSGDIDNSSWWIPLTWTTQGDAEADAFMTTKPQRWMKDTEWSITVKSESFSSGWIIFNNQETGYYRVAYDDKYWQAILQALQTNFEQIHHLNRAQLIDDALNLARANVISYEDALQVTLYLKEELGYVPWAAAFNAFAYLDSRLVSASRFSAFKRYVLLSVDKLYNQVTFDEAEGDKQTTILNRVNVLTWACKYGNEDCVTKSQEQFKAWMDNEDNTVSISANKKSVVYCTALQQGGETQWMWLWKRYLESDLATEQVLILNALGCTNDQAQLKLYLDKSIRDDSGIRKQDALSVFAAVYNNPNGVDTALDFMVGNFEEIITHYVGSNAISNAITGIAGKLTTQAQVNKLKKFIADNEAALGDNASSAGAKAIESAEEDLAWTKRYSDLILSWMLREAPGFSTRVQVNAVLTVLTALLLLCL